MRDEGVGWGCDGVAVAAVAVSLSVMEMEVLVVWPRSVTT